MVSISNQSSSDIWVGLIGQRLDYSIIGTINAVFGSVQLDEATASTTVEIESAHNEMPRAVF